MSNWRPIPGHIMTDWAETVDPDNPLPEYPRPQMLRDEWRNLNGLWEYAVTPRESSQPVQFSEKILVPFAIETALSGVKRPLLPGEKLWYRRLFQAPGEWTNKRILLHFEAVDWQCKCYLNEKFLGEHTGGYVPFYFDITGPLKFADNELIIEVWDPTDTQWQQRGKQVLNPGGIFYTATSGIWQTVWLEAVNMENHISELKLVPDYDAELLNLEVVTPIPGEVEVRILKEEKEITRTKGVSQNVIKLNVPGPRPWSPDDPFLYDLEIKLLFNNQAIDHVESYFAMRKISVSRTPAGHAHVELNNQPIFLHGPLDQGYWPESGMTPPCEDAIIFDIQKTRELGFNMTRQHIKVAPRRWYYHADRNGLIVVQDMVSGGKNMLGETESVLAILFNMTKPDNTSKSHKKAWRENSEARTDFEKELGEVINHLYNVPSILVWVLFNESMGQFDACRISKFLKELDPSRLIDHASGWFDQGVGNFKSRHIYFVKLKKPPENIDRIYFISEYGGYNYNVPDHLWKSKSQFGYGKYKTREALEIGYTKLIKNQLIPLIKQGLGAAVYTQLTDVEIETNGFYTYDRKILKIKPETIKLLNDEINQAFQSEFHDRAEEKEI